MNPSSKGPDNQSIDVLRRRAALEFHSDLSLISTAGGIRGPLKLRAVLEAAGQISVSS